MSFIMDLFIVLLQPDYRLSLQPPKPHWEIFMWEMKHFYDNFEISKTTRVLVSLSAVFLICFCCCCSCWFNRVLVMTVALLNIFPAAASVFCFFWATNLFKRSFKLNKDISRFSVDKWLSKSKVLSEALIFGRVRVRANAHLRQWTQKRDGSLADEVGLRIRIHTLD